MRVFQMFLFPVIMMNQILGICKLKNAMHVVSTGRFKNLRLNDVFKRIYLLIGQNGHRVRSHVMVVSQVVSENAMMESLAYQ